MATFAEIERFSELPMTATFKGEGEEAPVKRIVAVVSLDEASEGVVWRLADVKGNAPGMGRPMNKKTREQRWETTMADLEAVHLYIEL